MTPFTRKLILGCLLLLAACWVAYFSLRSRLSPRGKGDGVGCWMEGTVTNVSTNGESIHFTFTGTFHIGQWHGKQHSTIAIDCSRGVQATVFQGDPFFPMSYSWWTHSSVPVGGLGPAGTLLKLLKAAVEDKRVMDFELYDVKMAIGNGKDLGPFTLLNAGVIRASDPNLP